MTAQELMKCFQEMKELDDVFAIHESFKKLTQEEQEEFRRISNRDQVGMMYISAIELKKNGMWDECFERHKESMRKTDYEKIEKFVKDNGLTLSIPFPKNSQ